jgi:alkylated DNA repair protein alkB family protein 1
MKAPLISVSFGSSAVFLIGGNSRMIKPKAIHVTSGDFVIMSSTSRLAFHAVPKIFKNTNLNCIFNYENIDEKFRNSIYHVDDNEWKNYFEYIHINRINLNIRQVFD